MTAAKNPRSESRQKTALVQVRATPEEKLILKSRAAAFGISVGELCRQAIFGMKAKSKVDQQAILELSVARADLGRVGGLLKGWLSGSFQEGPRPNHDQVRDLLRKIEASQAVVADSAKRLTGES